uniref:Uncharacterized protein n=1 Tax=Lygus hesperus TaxID=30085 RepID=A0A0K8S7Z8_LYGHE
MTWVVRSGASKLTPVRALILWRLDTLILRKAWNTKRLRWPKRNYPLGLHTGIAQLVDIALECPTRAVQSYEIMALSKPPHNFTKLPNRLVPFEDPDLYPLPHMKESLRTRR